MQAVVFRSADCFSSKKSTALLFLITGVSISYTVVPIIGPPMSTLPGSLVKPPQKSARADRGVPIRARTFFGSLTQRPSTVITFWTRGIPVRR